MIDRNVESHREAFNWRTIEEGRGCELKREKTKTKGGGNE